MYKKTILIIAVVGVSWIFWFLVERWLASPYKFSLESNLWIWPLVGFILLIALEGLFFMIVRDRRWLIPGIFLSGAAYLIVFGVSNFTFLALGIFLLLQWSATGNVRREVNERLKISISEVVNHGLPNVVRSLLILLSFAYFLLPSVQLRAQDKQLPPTIRQIVERSLKEFSGEELSELPPEQQRSFISQVTDEVVARLTQVIGPYFKYLPPILAFGLFLVLQALMFAYIWLAVLLLKLMFWAFKKAGLIRLKMVQKEAEELEF